MKRLNNELNKNKMITQQKNTDTEYLKIKTALQQQNKINREKLNLNKSVGYAENLISNLNTNRDIEKDIKNPSHILAL